MRRMDRPIFASRPFRTTAGCRHVNFEGMLPGRVSGSTADEYTKEDARDLPSSGRRRRRVSRVWETEAGRRAAGLAYRVLGDVDEGARRELRSPPWRC
jgi:hypothetical protein